MDETEKIRARPYGPEREDYHCKWRGRGFESRRAARSVAQLEERYRSSFTSCPCGFAPNTSMTKTRLVQMEGSWPRGPERKGYPCNGGGRGFDSRRAERFVAQRPERQNAFRRHKTARPRAGSGDEIETPPCGPMRDGYPFLFRGEQHPFRQTRPHGRAPQDEEFQGFRPCGPESEGYRVAGSNPAWPQGR